MRRQKWPVEKKAHLGAEENEIKKLYYVLVEFNPSQQNKVKKSKFW